MQAVDLICFRLDEPLPFSDDNLARVLSDAERARAERFHFARDRMRFIRGRAVLRHCLARHLGVTPDAVPLEAGARGKPFVAGASGLAFNLSHTGDQAVLALGQGATLGVDIEALDRPVDPERLGQSVFTADELVRIAHAAEGDKPALFFTLWTAKEAVMKLTGEGMSLAPRAIAVTLSGSGTPVHARIDARAAPVTLTDIGFGGHIATLASLGPVAVTRRSLTEVVLLDLCA